MLLPRNELYVMEPAALAALCERISAIKPELVAKLALNEFVAGPGYAASGGIATVGVLGMLLRSSQDAQLYRAYGEEATGYGEIADAIDAANADPAIHSILLMIDSPGGQVAGVHDAADKIAKSAKPIRAHVQTLGASAAYWLASQAGTISASRGAQVGSIGAYMAIVDLSQAAANEGVKVHVISSGPYKGAGVPGAPISAEQLIEMQGRINAIRDEFVQDIATGRGESPTRINDSADGRVYNPTESKARGLIDLIAANPLADMKKAESMKDIAALLADHAAHAAFIGAKLAEGLATDAIRAEIEKLDRVNAVAAAKVEADKAKAEAVAAKAEKALADAKVVELEAALAAEKAASAALKALGDGAKASDKVLADPPKQEKSAEEVEAMRPLDQAKYYASLSRPAAK